MIFKAQRLSDVLSQRLFPLLVGIAFVLLSLALVRVALAECVDTYGPAFPSTGLWLPSPIPATTQKMEGLSNTTFDGSWNDSGTNSPMNSTSPFSGSWNSNPEEPLTFTPSQRMASITEKLREFGMKSLRQTTILICKPVPVLNLYGLVEEELSVMPVNMRPNYSKKTCLWITYP